MRRHAAPQGVHLVVVGFDHGGAARLVISGLGRPTARQMQIICLFVAVVRAGHLRRLRVDRSKSRLFLMRDHGGMMINILTRRAALLVLVETVLS